MSRWLRSGSLGLFVLTLVTVLASCGAPAAQVTPSAAPALSSLPRLAIINDPDKSPTLWTLEANGSNQKFLAADINNTVCAVSDDELVYGVYDLRGGGRMDAINVTTGVTRSLAYDSTAMLRTPICLPNGAGVIFERATLVLEDSEPQDPTLWRVNLDGSDFKSFLVVTETAGLNAQLAPDGSVVVFEDPAKEQLVVASLEGAEIKRLPFNGTFSWSPDGQQLVVAILNKTPEAVLFDRLVVVNIKTDEQRVLIEDSQADHYFPRWSPDGQTIAFIRRPLTSMTEEFWPGELWTIPAAGGGLPAARQITKDPAFDNLDPQWGVDSKTLAWSRVDVDEQFSIWRADMTTGTPVVVTVNARHPYWIKGPAVR